MNQESVWQLDEDGWEYEFAEQIFGFRRFLERTGNRRRWVPELGGWFYRLQTSFTSATVIFGPSLDVWSQAIAKQMATVLGSRQAISVELDLVHATDTKQPIPK